MAHKFIVFIIGFQIQTIQNYTNLGAKFVFYILCTLFPFLVTAQEPGWWTQKKRDCNITCSYNEWVKKGSPCNNVNNSHPTGPSAAEIEAQRIEEEKQSRNKQAVEFNKQGCDEFNKKNYLGALNFFEQAELAYPDDPTFEKNAITARKALIESDKRRQEEFNKSKQNALNEMKGISKSGDFDAHSGLKDVSTSNSGLKDGLNDIGTTNSGLISGNLQNNSNELKTIPEVNTDPMVVDTRNVPTGLPKNVENSIPNTPAGNRVRKGLQSIMDNDWKVALAWFQDALNHQPGDPGFKRLVDLAQYTLQKRGQSTNAPTPKKSNALNYALEEYNENFCNYSAPYRATSLSAFKTFCPAFMVVSITDLRTTKQSAP